MTGGFEDILLESEEVIWRGAPDHSLARKKPVPRWRVRFYFALWALGFFVATTGIVQVGRALGMDGFLGIFVGLLAVVFGLISVFLAIKVFDLGPSTDTTSETAYLLTNFRLVTVDGTADRFSLPTRHIFGVRLMPAGEAFDILIWNRFDERPALTLYSLADGPAVERLILQTLSHQKPDAPQ